MKNFKQYDDFELKILSNRLDIPLDIIKLLHNRDIETEEDILDFFLKDYKLTNPYYIPNMKKAVARITDAIDKGEKIVVVGDYDVDGMTSTAILYKFLESAGLNVEYTIPTRDEGYGLSKKIIDEFSYASIIITVDTGITNYEEVEYARLNNIDVIITDHHELGQKIPNAYAILNPKLLKYDYFKLKTLSGAGVAFYLVRALASKVKIDITDYLVLTAISTIADMVPLVNDNRIIVQKGIALLFETNLIGLNALLDKVNFYNYPNSTDVSFKLTPILNSAGRMGNPKLALDILIDESLSVHRKVTEIINMNKERRNLTKKQVLLAESLVDLTKDILIVSSPKFHSGIIGLIASNLVNKFNKPAIVIKEDSTMCTASCRSIDGFSINNVVSNTSDIHEGGGGHKMAAGFRIKKENIGHFKDEVENTKIDKRESAEIELSIDAFSLNNNLQKYIYHMEPFGMGNPVPIIQIKNIPRILDFHEFKKKDSHLKMITEFIDLFYFFPDKDEVYKCKNIVEEGLSFNVIVELHSDGTKIKGNILNIEAIEE